MAPFRPPYFSTNTCQNIRRYATEPSKSSANNAIFAGLAAAAGFGAYYYMTSTPSITTDANREAENVASKVINPNVAFKGGDQGWIDLKLDNIEVINHNTKKLRFLLPEADDVSGLKVASAILTKVKRPGQDKATIRPYTPVSDEDAKGHIDLLVKRYDGGPMSEHLHDMAVEQQLAFKGPIPKYPYEANKHSHIALIAGGTGITPMYQLARAIFNNPDDKTKVTLVFGNVTEADILLKHEFEELENTYPQRFRAFYVLDKPSQSWQQGKGRIDKGLLKTVLPEPKTEGIKIFVCGPPGLYGAISGGKESPKEQGEVSGVLKELGYSKEQVYKF